jgi:hypothetical protein
LQTSGARLEAVKQAAAAHEAEARAKAAAIAAREADARRAEEAAKRAVEEKRLAAEKARLEAEEKKRQAEEKRRQDELAAEKARLEAKQKKEQADREAEIKALPGKLASARRSLDVAEDKLKKIKMAKSRYPYSGFVPPEDYFEPKGRYIYFEAPQKAQRTKMIQEEHERLTAEIAGLEARIKASGKEP